MTCVGHDDPSYYDHCRLFRRLYQSTSTDCCFGCEVYGQPLYMFGYAVAEDFKEILVTKYIFCSLRCYITHIVDPPWMPAIKNEDTKTETRKMNGHIKHQSYAIRTRHILRISVGVTAEELRNALGGIPGPAELSLVDMPVGDVDGCGLIFIHDSEPSGGATKREESK